MGETESSWLLVGVIFVIALLAVIFLIPYLNPEPPPREEARRAKCMNNLKQIGLALREYAHDNNEVLPFGDGVEPYQAFGKLHPSYAVALEIFRCPSSKDEKWDASTAHEDYKSQAPFKKGACMLSLSYSYSHNRGNPWEKETSINTRVCADKYAAVDYSKGDDVRKPSNHRTVGNNILLLDGSVKWIIGKKPIEIDPEWDIKAGMSVKDPEYRKDIESDPEGDQTGSDWWSDPPKK
jgi:hypothetical protein